MATKSPDYFRYENMLAATRTQCDTETCIKGCRFPQCSKDWQTFDTEQAADRYQRQLALSGYNVVQEQF